MRWEWDAVCRATRCFPRQVHVVSHYVGRNNWMLWTCCRCTLATTTTTTSSESCVVSCIRHCRSCFCPSSVALVESRLSPVRSTLSNDDKHEYLWATRWSGDYWRRFDCRRSVQTGDKVEFDSLLRSKLNRFNSISVYFVEFDKIDRVEFDFVTSVYRALHCAVLQFSRNTQTTLWWRVPNISRRSMFPLSCAQHAVKKVNVRVFI